MKIYLTILAFNVLFSATFILAGFISPLCKDAPKSECNCTLNNSTFKIDCNGSELEDILKDENFIKTDNTTYRIDELVLTQLPLMYLNLVFPNSSLNVLNLSNNNIFNISDGVFQNLQKMEKLVLSKNSIQFIDGEVFKGLRRDGQDFPLISLKELYLDFNLLHSLHSDIFKHIDRQLERLYLNNNPFKVIDTPTLQAINSLVYLKELGLSDTGIKTLPPNFFHTPAHLEIIDLSFNLFESVKDLNLQESHVLKFINLNGNHIVNLTEENGFPNVSTIHTVHMCQMPLLEEVGPHSLSKLSSLENLYLSDNPKLSRIYEKAFLEVSEDSEVPFVLKLKNLYLGNNRLSHLNFSIDWNLLDYVDIRGNPWSCECTNERLISILYPIIEKEDPKQAEELVCAFPEQMEGRHFKDVYESNIDMRCLDVDGNHPERDGIILVCILLGLLLVILLGSLSIYSYQRNFYGLFDKSPAAFSRQFYNRTRVEDNEFL